MFKRTISKLAQEAGVNVETIRFIKRTKELGFTLDEIAHLLSLENK